MKRLQLISPQVPSPLEFPSLQRRWENRPRFKALGCQLLRLRRLVGQPPRRSCTPLCSLKQQVREMIMFQSRAPWLYGDRPSRSFFPALRRPPVLETEEARMTAESTEMSTMRAYMKELIAQNEELTKRVHALETGFSVPEVDLSFSTPNGSEPLEVSKEAARPPEALKEAARTCETPRSFQGGCQTPRIFQGGCKTPRSLQDHQKESPVSRKTQEENVHK